MRNLILNTDSYKVSHFLQYPAGTQYVSSYIESRGGAHPTTLFFGLQAFLKEYLCHPISATDIDEAEAVCQAHGVPFNREGWEYILQTHDGYLPLEIQAVPEGSIIATGNVLVQVMNTDPACAWLTSYVETGLLRAVWYPTSVATVSRSCRDIIQRYLEQTSDTTDNLAFKLHDFGARGASSEESAALGGAAHLVNFMGTDTLSGILAARRYYSADMAGFSIPAAEHSTITSWGRDGELAAYTNMLDQFSGDGRILAVVSDSWDLWNAIDNLWGDELKSRIETSGGTLVVRPDSGEPVEVVPEAIERLMARFGYRTNSKGYRVLPDCIRLIQGDGINAQSIAAILAAMKERELSADNITFGMGGALMQKVHRDTHEFAMKASAICVDEQWRDVYKDPVTAPGKRSKRGRLALVDDDQGYRTVREDELDGRSNALVTVFRNGRVTREWSLEEIRQRAAGH
ncbi:nicotinate phosphoribosyltransferase [Halomonas huangheensis]|uniref:Nicotinamide phosphoribosyltransferase n=1 Tax=Halomonas huangheensis TaxID=1178482 RepID=W1N6B9_9GAMM|nr:nicotinate phosphoribosyltransferase [Halomonas huangheensis]ALM51089.1 nicotinate phosphoribosyltransferase [Halomonas huangheensis]ERL51117.1 nicotinate phosphoribosyltransferase [Halomonas huangheensis]